MNNHSIYCLKCPISNEIKYIGATRRTLERRLEAHLDEAMYEKRHRSKKTEWIKSLLDISMLPKIELLEKVDSSIWVEKEKEWISWAKENGYDLKNSTDGGIGPNGMQHTALWKKSLSERLTGKESANKGKKLGKRENYVFVYDKNVIDKQLEVRNNNIKKKGKKCPSSSKGLTSEIVQYTLSGIFIKEYKCAAWAAKELGISRQSITECLRGAKNKAHGFVFKFKYPKEEVICVL